MADELIPDYLLSKEEVYKRLTLLLIKEQESLFALKGQRVLQDGLASWIYDWSSNTDELIWHFENIRLISKFYKASKDEKPVVQSQRDGRLSIDGVFVDRVVEQGQICLNSSHSRLQALRQWYRMCQDFEKQLQRSSWREDFLSTVTSGLYYNTESDGSQRLRRREKEMKQEDVFEAWQAFKDQPGPNERSDNANIDMFNDLVKTMASGLRFFLTEKGLMGLGNPEPGDEIWVLLGGDVPFLLRQDTASTSYFLIGDCYAHGIMDGEALEDLQTARRTIHLK